MKNKFYILSLIIPLIFVFFTLTASAQSKKDTMAFIRIGNSRLIDLQTLEFDMLIERKSRNWIKFVNGTFSLYFEDSTNFKLTADDIIVNPIRSQLKQDVEVGASDIPTRGYRTDYKVYDNRLSITILGPESFEDCDSVAFQNSLLLGTFQVHSKKNALPDFKMQWLTPYYWYQGCAFKLAVDSLINNEITYFISDDNVSMEDSTSITYVFINDTTNRAFDPVIFNANYIGQKQARYDWLVRNEYNVQGYSVYRTIEIPGFEVTKFDDLLLGTWREGEKFNSAFIARGNFDKNLAYGEFPDIIEFRGGNYIYSLYASVKDSNGIISDIFLDTAKIPAPRAVIVKAKIIGANPFSTQTVIEYTIDDDCYITAYASDLLGKEIKKLKNKTEDGDVLDKLMLPKGTYTTIFRAPELASQGLYNIIITASPILDPTVEVSRAVVKVQLVR